MTTTVSTWWSVRGRSAVRATTAATARARGRYVSVRIAAVGDDAPPRLLMAVSRHVGGAVTRNLVRRRIRHVLAGLAPADAQAVRGCMVMVRADPAAASADWTAFSADLVEQVRRASARRSAGAASVTSASA